MSAATKQRLTWQDKARIEDLAEKGFGACRIAKRIGRNKSAVVWHLYRTGLKAPVQLTEPKTTWRNDKPVHWFTRDEDEFIQRLRQEGLGQTEIARSANAIWNRNRTRHSIEQRLMMLAAIEDLTP